MAKMLNLPENFNLMTCCENKRKKKPLVEFSSHIYKKVTARGTYISVTRSDSNLRHCHIYVLKNSLANPF